jgi:uncharacterized protein (TIGR03437 family)
MRRIVSIAALLGASLVAHADIIAAWTFENNTIAMNNSPAPSTGSGTATSLGMDKYPTPNVGVITDDVLLGAAGDTGVNGVANLSQIWRVRAQAGTAGAANGWSSQAPIGTQGVMFAVSTVGYTNITVSFDWYATNQGMANMQVQYTTDGSTWKNVALNIGSNSGIAVMNNATSANTVKGSYVSITGGAGQSWFAGLTAVISDQTAANNPKFAIQIVNASTGADCTSASGTALNNNSGNWRFDNVAISGTSTFTGFTAGNLVLSRSVLATDRSTVVVGQALPPVCPAAAETAAPGACKGAKATDNGAYASTDSANNIFNNNKVDGSFGVTSPIFLEQLTPSGTTVNSFAVPTNLIVTSFSSKSELALNLSTDGSVITFMGYVAAPNTVDVSNSNTPGVYDPTNPAGGSYFRAVAQVSANGAIQITPTNAYSGNNGRAAILANGQYYMVGNSNNGAGTPDNVVNATGVEIATPGQAANTVPREIGSFSISQINPLTGQVYAVDAKDKPGKDNNFRGLTIFNNTLYVTKGSGSNGIDTVYQVGNSGSLPTLADAGGAAIAPLPGFPTISARLVGATDDYPFGIWFANANTLYVADEGDGVLADAAGSATAGLQKWILSGGTWKMAYVLQKGLNLGQAYSIANYPAALNPATAGLRNITGKVNSDGTVTIYGVTSTVSANGDQGADPNKLVSITDTLANTTASGAASETFTTLRTAVAGEILRGISFAPSSTTMPNVPVILSAASPSVAAIAAGGLAFAIGQNLAPQAPEVLGPSPSTLDGTSVTIQDAAGTMTSAPLVFVSPSQVTFQVPSTVAAGMATVTVKAPGSTQTASNVVIAPVAPAVFTVNGNALLAGYAVRVSTSGTQTTEPAYASNAQGSFSAAPINMGSATDKVYLTIYATGVQAAGLANVSVTVNGVSTTVLYAGASAFNGVDQINVQLPASLAGAGTVALQVTASGTAANPVQVAIQ